MSTSDHGGLGAGSPELVAAFWDALRSYADSLTANFTSLTDAQPEDQLKAPVAELIRVAGHLAGQSIVTRTETRVDGVAGRPDLGVDADGLPVGNTELKAPGRGARPERFKDKRSRDQFDRFTRLPNLLYTDGREWALYRSGDLVGDIVKLSSDPTSSGRSGITTDDAASLLNLLGEFLEWEPVVPSSPRALAGVLAPLTRLLRDEVLADVKKKGVMDTLANEWRATLFPDADDATFADGYAQTFTYALLLARLEGAQPPLTAETAAAELDSDHALLAQALRNLGQPGTREAIGLPVGLLERVVGAVDATKLNAGDRDPWLYFYEDFLAAYDPVQRNNRGVYYTPFEVVGAQVRLCHHVLTDRFGLADGFADPSVVVLDPAVGTGTYLLQVASHALDEAVERSGPGVKGQVATRLVDNLAAFEILVGPYAVSHLRLSRALSDAGAEMPDTGVRVYLTDTLASPTHEGFAEQATLFQARLAEEQEAASRIKTPEAQVTVVIGNPPYDRDESEKSKGDRRKGGMVRYSEDGTGIGLIKDFIGPLRDAGAGGQARNLYNDYVYFWRWAIWKACQQHDNPSCVSFITASSFLRGRGFTGMREVMRREFDELWFIDLGGDGRGTRRDENTFSNVMTPVVITVAVRRPGADPSARRLRPAVVRYRRIEGTRDEKFAVLNALDELQAGADWELAPEGWLEPFVPRGSKPLNAWPQISDLFPWNVSGVKAGRTWVVDADGDVLKKRWLTLLSEQDPARRQELFKDSPTGRKVAAPLRPSSIMPGTFAASSLASAAPSGDEPTIARLAFRSFDRANIIADPRVIDRPGPTWSVAGQRQVFLASLTTEPLGLGPALTASADVPDLHFFRGRGGKDIVPLWRDADCTSPNVTVGLLDVLSTTYGTRVTADDLAAYVMGLLGTSAYTERFHDELRTSPARVPLTTSPEVFSEVVSLGRNLLWWQTFGERYQPVSDSGRQALRLPAGTAKNTVAVSASPDAYPESFSYDSNTETVHVGDGAFAPVSQAMWDFEVSGLKILHSWLGYRMKKRAGKKSSELDDIRPERWTFSEEFVTVLSIVERLVEAQTEAAELLERVVEGELLLASDLPTPTDAERAAPKAQSQPVPPEDDAHLPLG